MLLLLLLLLVLLLLLLLLLLSSSLLLVNSELFQFCEMTGRCCYASKHWVQSIFIYDSEAYDLITETE